jgi:hypothetical protein
VRKTSVKHKDLVEIWGEGDIFVASPEAIEAIPLPESARRILVEVGLPKTFDQQYAGNIFESVSPVLMSGSTTALCRIGVASGAVICVNLDSGDVIALSCSQNGRDYFINSTIELFVYFLCKFAILRKSYVDSSDSEIKARAEAAEGGLRLQDPRAFNDPENWWPLIFEQVRDGFM